MKKVKCSVCGEIFDRDKEPFVMTSSRRYAHERCVKPAEISQNEVDYNNLLKCAKSFLGDDYVDAIVKRQIRDYHQDYKFTYTGMEKTLNYWYNVKKGKSENACGGIGIIPFIYKEASEYYYALYLAALTNENLSAETNVRIKEYTIEAPEMSKLYKRDIKLFKLGDEE